MSNLELLDQLADTEPKAVTDLSDAWKAGNVLRFTVKDVNVSGGRLTKGCKSGPVADVFSKIHSKQGSDITFEAEIEKGAWDTLIIRIPGSIDYIRLGDAVDFFEDVLLVKEATPQGPKTIELTQDELNMLQAVLGRASGGGPTSSIYTKVIDAGAISGRFNVETNNGDRAPMYCVRRNA